MKIVSASTSCDFSITTQPDAVNDDAPGVTHFPWRNRDLYLEESLLLSSMEATLVRLPAKPWFSTRAARFAKTSMKYTLSVLAPEVRKTDHFELPPWNLAHHSVAYAYSLASLWLHGACSTFYLCVPSSALLSGSASAAGATTPITETIAKQIDASLGYDEQYLLAVVPDRKLSEFLVAVAIASRNRAVMTQLIVALGSDVSDALAPHEVSEEFYLRFERGPGDARLRQMLGGIAASRSVLDVAKDLYEVDMHLIPKFGKRLQQPPDEAAAA